ncbi:hypothetical protein N1031_02820 [Herbiconiux moechotypicola]|uniref:Uncharacterized protein n=1 Tax=Herbiconiux moechotypicola TaxID=637393 RepID=A0ABN3DCX2_9MICO|nr:hypothetical protein [Herbiconiux moechotypicola]MCS5728680.1 hypothetical protein [Herbiconiux moechotypicola]
MTATDLIGNPLTAQEQSLLAIYRELESFAADDTLAPTTHANVLAALAPLGVAVTGLGITLEHLVDIGA